jgi:hypothetical protein
MQWKWMLCAVNLKSAWKLACKDGPVFDWMEMESKAAPWRHGDIS